MMSNLRYLIVLATFLLSVLLYVDRVCISAAKDAVSRDLQLSETQMGWIFSSFALGYALMQTPSGRLADVLGARRVLSLIVIAWSLFTGLTALANSWATMMGVRFLFGAGEAGAFPGMARAVYSWIPMRERGLVQGINFSGSRLGAALTLPLISWSIAEIGWRVTFLILMVIGFAWAIAWFLLFRDDPEEVRWLGAEEKRHILATRQPQESRSAKAARVESGLSATMGFEDQHSPIGAFFSSSTMWALCSQYFASNFVFFFGLTWFFPQMKSQYSLSGFEASLFAAVPMLFGAMGNWVSGWWVDSLFARGQWVLSRRLPATIGFCLAGAGILGCAYATTPMMSSIWFSLCIFGADMTLPASWSTCVDIGRENAGVVSGTMNMAGNLGSFVTSLAFPYLLNWSGSSLPFFYIAAGLCLAATFSWMLINPTRPIGVTA